MSETLLQRVNLIFFLNPRVKHTVNVMSWDTTKLLILWALSEVAVCPLPVPFTQYPVCHGICEVLRIENPLPAEGSLKFGNREKCAVLVEIILER